MIAGSGLWSWWYLFCLCGPIAITVDQLWAQTGKLPATLAIRLVKWDDRSGVPKRIGWLGRCCRILHRSSQCMVGVCSVPCRNSFKSRMTFATSIYSSLLMLESLAQLTQFASLLVARHCLFATNLVDPCIKLLEWSIFLDHSVITSSSESSASSSCQYFSVLESCDLVSSASAASSFVHFLHDSPHILSLTLLEASRLMVCHVSEGSNYDGEVGLSACAMVSAEL